MSLPMLPYKSLVKLASRIWIASQQQNHSQSSLVNPFKMNNRVYTRRPKKMVIAEIQSACVAVFHFCTDLSTEPLSGTLAARFSTSAKPILGEEGRREETTTVSAYNALDTPVPRKHPGVKFPELGR